MRQRPDHGPKCQASCTCFAAEKTAEEINELGPPDRHPQFRPQPIRTELLRPALPMETPLPEGVITQGFTEEEPSAPRNAGRGITPEELKEAMQGFDRVAERTSEWLSEWLSENKGVFQAIEGAWDQMRKELPEEFSDKPIHPGTLRDARGIKRPSTVPPFWANKGKRGRR